MHVLLDDDEGRLTIQRIGPWTRMLARVLGARLDRELADGTRPEANASLAARAMRLTSMDFRCGLAASLQRMLAAATGEQARVPSPAAGSSLGAPRPPHVPLGAPRPPHVPLGLMRISQSAPLLADLAGRLVEPGPVPVRGVAMVSQLLADGTGPLYREACRDDLGAIVARAARALAG